VTDLTQQFARFAAGATAVPGDVRALAARAMAAVTAAAAGRADHPAVAAIAKVADDLGTPPEAGVPGRSQRYSAPWAALLIGAAASGIGATGYAAVVVPAGLAAGAERRARLDAVADAVAIGLEIAERLDAALAGSLGAFDRVATIGRLGGAATAGRLLGLPTAATAHALGIAATQAAGFACLAAEPIGALQCGKAAADAVQAAYLAAAGFTAATASIEGRRGFTALLAPRAEAQDAAADLSRTWILRSRQ
jgi:2-methylcitrate dehydratase PrpD